jgi:small-conductance mechanosensitive channel
MAMHRMIATTASHLAIFAIVGLLAAILAPASAQTVEPTAPSQNVERFLDLLKDPSVQSWLQQRDNLPANPAQAPIAPRAPGSFSEFTTRFRGHLASLLSAARSLPDETTRAATILRSDVAANGGTRPIFLVGAFVLAGLAGQFLFRLVSAKWRARTERASAVTPRDRAILLTLRFAWGACHVLSFTLASIGFFLLFDWPPLVREIVVGYLFAIVVFRLVIAVLEVFLAPDSVAGKPFRLVPASDGAARFWARRLGYLAGFTACGWVTVRLLAAFGFSDPSRLLVAYGLGLVIFALIIQTVWSCPRDAGSVTVGRFGRTMGNWLWTAYFLLLWLLWVAGATRLFWIAAICAALPGAIAITRASFENIFRSPTDSQETDSGGTVLSVILERGIRAALIVGSIVILADVLDVNLIRMTTQDSPGLRIIRGILSAGIILLVVDLAWNIVKVLIDRKLRIDPANTEVGSEAAHRKARIRTLLPILRNFLMVLFAAIAIMMALSSVGIEIGPLIAGAGIVGVAIGFGAQSVVKDIISGMFYLLDDAFRIGEYIQSGSYRGTVEGFSLRSIRLRHHRGPIFIVPFSELGAVQNMSRDWSVVKFMLSVSYDSDVAQVKAITKIVGKALKEDPEFNPFIIENLKMKGIEEINDQGTKLSFGMTLKPTQLQSSIRRRAYAMLRKAFTENGIDIAVPTVKVSGGKEDDLAAAAQQAIAKQTAPIVTGVV